MKTRELKNSHPALYREIYRTGRLCGRKEESNRLADIVKIYKENLPAAIQCFFDGLNPVEAAIRQHEVITTITANPNTSNVLLAEQPEKLGYG
jgi:hypothetical protein